MADGAQKDCSAGRTKDPVKKCRVLILSQDIGLDAALCVDMSFKKMQALMHVASSVGTPVELTPEILKDMNRRSEEMFDGLYNRGE